MGTGKLKLTVQFRFAKPSLDHMIPTTVREGVLLSVRSFLCTEPYFQLNLKWFLPTTHSRFSSFSTPELSRTVLEFTLRKSGDVGRQEKGHVLSKIKKTAPNTLEDMEDVVRVVETWLSTKMSRRQPRSLSLQSFSFGKFPDELYSKGLRILL